MQTTGKTLARKVAAPTLEVRLSRRWVPIKWPRSSTTKTGESTMSPCSLSRYRTLRPANTRTNQTTSTPSRTAAREASWRTRRTSQPCPKISREIKISQTWDRPRRTPRTPRAIKISFNTLRTSSPAPTCTTAAQTPRTNRSNTKIKLVTCHTTIWKERKPRKVRRVPKTWVTQPMEIISSLAATRNNSTSLRGTCKRNPSQLWVEIPWICSITILTIKLAVVPAPWMLIVEIRLVRCTTKLIRHRME